MSRDLPPYESLVRWTVTDVLDWLRKANLNDLRDTFRASNIDGAKLAKLQDSEIDEFKSVSKKKREQLKIFVGSVDRSKANSIPKVSNNMRSWQPPSNPPPPSSRPPAPIPGRDPAPPPRPAPAPVNVPPSPSYEDEADPYDLQWSDDEFSDQEDYENLEDKDGDEDYENMGNEGGAPPVVPRRTPAASTPDTPPRRGPPGPPSHDAPAPPPPRRVPPPQPEPNGDAAEDDDDYVEPVEPSPEPPPSRGRRPVPPPQADPTPPPPRSRPRAPAPAPAPTPPPSRPRRAPSPPKEEDVYEQPDPEPQAPPPLPPGRKGSNRRLPPPPDALDGSEWYQGAVRRQQAEAAMKSLGQDGMFVVRKSDKSPTQPYTLMIHKAGHVYNLPVRVRSDKKVALGREKPQELSFSTVGEMIDYFRSRALVLNPAAGERGQTPLMYPLPRQ